MSDHFNTSHRDRTFDIMKGIGIMLVIICHFYGWSHPYLARVILSFHMPLFFLVAGYFSKPYMDVPTFKNDVKRYFKRLYTPMAVTQLMIVLWALLMVIVKHDGWETTIREALSLLWADVDGPITLWGKLSLGVIWFLLALFVAKTLLIPLSRLKKWAIPVSLSVALGALLLHHVFPYSIWCISLGMMALPFVTIGWWIRNHPFPAWMNCLAIGCWIIAILFSELDMYSFTWKCYPLDVLGAYGGTYCIYLASKWIGKRLNYTADLLACLGVASLAIMCAHCFEIATHLSNHLRSMAGIELQDWSLYLWRFFLTLFVAFFITHAPFAKRIFL